MSLEKFSCYPSFISHFPSQALVRSLGKGVEKLILLPSAIHSGRTQETAQFAVWEGMNNKGRGGHRLTIDAEETTLLSQK